MMCPGNDIISPLTIYPRRSGFFSYVFFTDCLQGGGVERLYRAFRRELFKAVLKAPPVLAGKDGSDSCGGSTGGDCGSGGVTAGGASSKSVQW